MADIDLTPFGFTPTENLAYGALLEMGPSSGYALAKELSIARANAYQALNGLAAKGAAVAIDGQPQRYRAERPDAILARVIDSEARKLDTLAAQVDAVGERDGVAIIELRGARGLVDVALRTVARESGEVTCLAEPALIAALGPAWRHRASDSRVNSVWIVGDDPGGLPVRLAGTVDTDRLEALLGGGGFVLLAGDVALIARGDGQEIAGYWTSDATIVGAARGLAAHLTAI
jgi:sugar-specific transcriptional regulator TrmB